jgi:nicotinamide mononucleotide transporter
MTWMEAAAAVLGVANVALVIRRSLWNYPFGIAMVGLYFFVFADAKLYSDAILQLFFCGIQLYGWANWRTSAARTGEVAVERLSWRHRIGWLAATAVAAALWGAGMARFTDAAAPYADAAIAAMSVTAQLLQSRRVVESWVLWIAVDLLAIGVFWSRGLVLTSALYAIFLVLASLGLVEWARRARAA